MHAAGDWRDWGWIAEKGWERYGRSIWRGKKSAKLIKKIVTTSRAYKSMRKPDM